MKPYKTLGLVSVIDFRLDSQEEYPKTSLNQHTKGSSAFSKAAEDATLRYFHCH